MATPTGTSNRNQRRDNRLAPALPAEALSRRERTVLYGMVRFPSLNDRRLAVALGERQSTMTSVRAGLEERGLGRRIWIPSLAAMGAGVLSAGSGSIATGGLFLLRRALGRGHFQAGACDSFLSVADTSGWLEMGAFRDYSQARARGGGIRRALDGLPAGTARQPSTESIFPAENLRIHNFFDFGPLLARHFGVRETALRAQPFPAAPARRLGTRERLALYGLVRWPGEPDGRIAGALGISGQAVARARTRLAAEGRLRPAVVPDLRRLGTALLAVLRFRLAARPGNGSVEGAVERLLDGLPHIFAVSAGTECLVLAAFSDTAAFDEGAAGLIRSSAPAGRLDGLPGIHTCSLDEALFVRDLDFVPFVKSALGLDIAD